MTGFALSDQPGSADSIESRVPVALFKAFGASAAEHVPGLGTGAWLLTGRAGVDVVVTPATPAAIEVALAAADVAVGPRVLDVLDGWLVCERLHGSHLTSLELRRPCVLEELATMFARLHSTTVSLPAASMLDSLPTVEERIRWHRARAEALRRELARWGLHPPARERGRRRREEGASAN